MIETRLGGCHCKKVRYEAKLDLGQPAIECNCSHCQIKGLLLSFIPEEGFRLLEGESELAEYRFNTKKIAHLFCKHCGVESFACGEDNAGNRMIAINVRALDDIELANIAKKQYDGRSIETTLS